MGLLWLIGASYRKDTIDRPWEVVYEESIGTKMNDLDICLESLKVMSTIASHSPLNILKTVRDRGLVPKYKGNGLRERERVYFIITM